MSLLQMLLSLPAGATGGPDIVATGGTINEYVDGGVRYRTHTFLASSTFSVTSAPPTAEIDLLVVAGGGGGSGSIPSYWQGAGGGAGGMLEIEGYPISGPATYPITVGAGGAGSRLSSPPSVRGFTGIDSVFANPGNTSINAVAKGGGGGGGSGPAVPGTDVRDGTGGGSCGGVGEAPGLSPVVGPAIVTSPLNPNISALPGTTLNHYGNVGGQGKDGTVGESGGGGGAGGAGTNVAPPFSATQSNPGGPGRANTLAGGPSNPVTYAAGGASFTPAPTRYGTPSTGNGGGGGANHPGAEAGGNGGSGIVVVRYQISPSTNTARATGGAIRFTGTKTLHVFSSTSTFTVTDPTLTSVEVLGVAGGGGGGSWVAGGGGGGGVFYHSALTVGLNSYTVQIGAGGRGGIGEPGSNPAPDNFVRHGSNGGDTTFSGPDVTTITAKGGGGGGGYSATGSPSSTTNGNPGGSGGAAAGDAGGTAGNGIQPSQNSPYTPNPNFSQYGNNAGTSLTASPHRTGGGGGASAAGQNATPTDGGDGGAGIGAPTIPWLPTDLSSDGNIGGGGGGSSYDGTEASRGLGKGGGGSGGYNATYAFPHPSNTEAWAQEGTGGGGGGSGYYIPGGYSFYPPGGNGGSGLLIIAYPS